MPLFGGLNIEQSLLVMHGQLIDGSGLMDILNQHKFSTIGLSAVVDVNSIKRARYCVQVTLCALYIKVKYAAVNNNSSLPPYEWLRLKSKESETCFFWKMVMDFQINILIFVRSIREGNFKLYVEVIRKLMKWYFILDRYNYARWLSVHLFDLMTMEVRYPDVYDSMVSGCFSFQKTNHEFSRMALDQVHEQNNRTIKASGGATNLVNKADDSALIRWETCGPDIARLITEFEDSMQNEVIPNCTSTFEKHHEDNASFQETFARDVKTLCNGMPVNPFQLNKLTKINNSTVSVPDIAFMTVKEMEDKGEEQFNAFLYDRLIYQKVSICATIPKNKINIWNITQPDAEKPYVPSNSVINKMRSACEHRPDLAQKVFEHEIFDVPQSLSTNSVSMYHGAKSDITKRLSSFCDSRIPTRECKSAVIIEMSPLIIAKCFSLTNTTCFSDFAVLLYYYILKLGMDFDRIDLVFDRYFDNSLKEDTRKNRGSGSRFAFTNDTALPNNMTENFLKNSQNKEDLNQYLAMKFIEIHNGPKTLVVTFKDTVLCAPDTEPINLPDISISKCQSEEADQRLVRHTLHCLSYFQLYKRVVVRTIDTDVLILLISYVGQYFYLNSDVDVYAELINTPTYYNIIEICKSLGLDICNALPFFYAFTGCDIVSSFYNKGKCKAWDTWFKSEKKDLMTQLFSKLGNRPEEIYSDEMDVLEDFVINLYSTSKRNSSLASINTVRLDKFRTSPDNDLRKLPPSREALTQHAKRACYQAGFLWKESLEDFDLPDPTLWGWAYKNETYIPLWQSKTSSVDIETFTTTCSCLSQKCKNCKCSRLKIPCLSMCGCARKCPCSS